MTLGIFMMFYALTIHIVGTIAEKRSVQRTAILLVLAAVISKLLDMAWVDVPL